MLKCVANMQSPSDVGWGYGYGIRLCRWRRSEVAAFFPFSVQRAFDRVGIEFVVQLAQVPDSRVWASLFGMSIRSWPLIRDVIALPSYRGRDGREGTLCPGSCGIDRAPLSAQDSR